MTITAFDNVNKLGDAGEYRFDFEEYYSAMEITPEQKKKREELADDLMDELLILFALYLTAIRYNAEVDKARTAKDYESRIRAVLENHNIDESLIRDYLLFVALEEANVTHNRYRDDPYWTSNERAFKDAAGDSNTVWGNQEYMDAVKNGARWKQWITMKDERVRVTHEMVDDKILPIDEPFVVGGRLMQFPGDINGAPEETANCRCSVSYF